MPRKKNLILNEPVRNGLNVVKVRLDHRTIITLRNLKMLDFWKQRYPQAQVIG